MKPRPAWTGALLLAGLLLAPSPAAAVDTDFQEWSLFMVQKDLGKRWIGYFEVQPRFGNDVSELDRLIVRPAVGYRINPNISIWQGYGYTPQFAPAFRGEHRSFQQLLAEHDLGTGRIINRTRLEQRFIDDAGGTSVRLRHMVRLTHPIGRSKRWSWVGYNEFFFNLNSVSAGPQAGFDQNRVFVGVNRKVNQRLLLEAGYLADFINSPAPTPDRRLDVLVTSVLYKL